MQLNYQDLKKYMTIVYELEEEICFQNELMAKLQQKIKVKTLCLAQQA